MSAITVTQNSGTSSTITIANGTAEAQLQNIDSTDLVQRVTFLMAVVALAVIEEDPTTTSHVQRLSYARLVVGNPTVFSANAIWQVCADGVIGSSSTDQTIINRITAIWTDLSNIG